MIPHNAIRFYLDNNVYDLIVALSREVVTSAAANGRAKFYSSHVTEDELMAMPPEKDEKLLALIAVLKQVTEEVPSAPAVFGYGKYGRTRFGDETSNGIYDSLKAKHDPPDAIHVATANSIGCDYFVTEDKELRSDIDRLRLKMKPLSFEEMTLLLGNSVLLMGIGLIGGMILITVFVANVPLPDVAWGGGAAAAAILFWCGMFGYSRVFHVPGHAAKRS